MYDVKEDKEFKDVVKLGVNFLENNNEEQVNLEETVTEVRIS